MAKIVVSYGIPTGGLRALSEHQLVMPPYMKAFSDAEMREALRDADAVIACGAITEEMLAAAKQLKIISNYGAGYDRVNVQAATARRIPVTNIPDSTTLPTAEVAIGLMLAAARRICELNARLRTENTKTLFGLGVEMGIGLQGKTLGIVGMGRIGGTIAKFGELMGMRVVYYNRHPQTGSPYTLVALDELMRGSDVISVHCPLTAETRGLISAERIALMRKDAILINTARGPVVDSKALADALREHRIAAAGIDVFDHEPDVPDYLLELPNAVLTPHIGTNTLTARDHMAQAAAERVLAALDGKRPPNVVNPEIYEE